MNAILAVSVIIITVILCRWAFTPRPLSTRRLEVKVTPANPAPGFTAVTQAAVRSSLHCHTDIIDTVVNHTPLLMLVPCNASSSPESAVKALSDRNAVLVVENAAMILDNPDRRELRKAMVSIAGCQSVVLSRRRLSDKDFRTALASLGASEIIPLPPGNSYCRAVNARGDKIEYGHIPAEEKTSDYFIVWK